MLFVINDYKTEPTSSAKNRTLKTRHRSIFRELSQK